MEATWNNYQPGTRRPYGVMEWPALLAQARPDRSQLPYVTTLRILALLAAVLRRVPLATAHRPYPTRDRSASSSRSPPAARPTFSPAASAAQLAERWGQPFVSRTGPAPAATSAPSWRCSAAPDGYTLIVNSVGPIAVNPSLYRKLGFNPLTDLVPIAQIADVPNVLVVHPSMPVKSLEEFVAYAKANPGKLSYGSTGIGTSSHLSGFLLASARASMRCTFRTRARTR